MIHPVIAGLLFSIIFLWIIIESDIYKNTENLKKLFYIFLFFLIISLLYIFFKSNTFKVEYKPIFYIEDYYNWIKYWDTHRNPSFDNKSIIYIFNQGILICLLFILYKKFTKFSNVTKFFLYLLIISLIIFILKPFYPDLIRRFMINRIAIIPQFVVMVYLVGMILMAGKLQLMRFTLVAISFSIFLISGYLYSNNLSRLPSATNSLFSVEGFLLRVYVVSQSYIGGFKRMTIYEEPSFNLNFNISDKSELPLICGNGLMVTAASISRQALFTLRMPLLLDPGGFDFVSYFPEYATDVRRIITEIYGIQFSDPAVAKSLDDAYIKDTFELRDTLHWKQLSKDFGFKYLVVPVEWNIKLPTIYKNNQLRVLIVGC
jgi:hypothetical protein